jgi:hypothetical protein
MSNRILCTSPLRKQTIELSNEERAQLNIIIDLLIPSDKDFPPPSSLHLIDEFLHYLLPDNTRTTTLMLSEKRLRTVLHDLNALAGGNFCSAGSEKQYLILHHLERRDPAFFQSLWTLANHSYYTHLATARRPSGVP